MKKPICLFTIKEFNHYFNRLPVDFTNTDGAKYATYLTTVSELYETMKIEAAINRMAVVRPFHDPDGEFKEIALITNRVTGEKIALIGM